MERVIHYLKQIYMFFILLVFLRVVHCEDIDNFPTTYVVAGKWIELVCPPPPSTAVLDWRFHKNNSDVAYQDVAQYFQGTVTYHNQFDQPPGRTKLIGGRINITAVQVRDEGEYWCELRTPGQEVTTSKKYPVHVYVKPQNPEIERLGANLEEVLEYTTTKIAQCKSTGGKPASKLSWWNGTVLMPNVDQPVIIRNFPDGELYDITLDLTVKNWTRFDFERNFTCLVEHPAYDGHPKMLNRSVKVRYHPVNARIWANLTTRVVFCEADGYPKPVYSWIIPGDIKVENSSTLQASNIYELPEEDFFQCTADNKIPHPAIVKAYVEDLLYPNGKPVAEFLGLSIYIWIAIGGGALLLIIIIIIIVCCCLRRKKKKKGGSKYTGPQVKHSTTRHSQPSLLEFDSMRTPDGRESSLPPNDPRVNKAEMARAYSLENIAERKFGGDPRYSVNLVPLAGSGPRNDFYNDTSLNRRASREEIDKVVDHIEVLNKSWDNLAKSREHLVRSREGLNVADLPPQYRSHDDLSQPRDRLDDRDAYPYMDETLDNRPTHETYRSYSNRNYYEHEVIPQRPDYYRDTHQDPPPNRARGDSYRDDQYRDDNYRGRYEENQPYSDRYNDNRPYNDRYQTDQSYDNRYHDNQSSHNRYHDDQSSRNRYKDDQNYRDGYDQYGRNYAASSGGYDQQNSSAYRQPDYNRRESSFGDSEFDDDQGYGYQPASMI